MKETEIIFAAWYRASNRKPTTITWAQLVTELENMKSETHSPQLLAVVEKLIKETPTDQTAPMTLADLGLRYGSGLAAQWSAIAEQP